MRRLIARQRRGKHNHCLPPFQKRQKWEICGNARKKTGLNLCNKAERYSQKSRKSHKCHRSGDTVACKPVSTPGSASSPEFSTKILEQKSFCTFRDPILRDRTIRLTNIMTDWSKQRKGSAARRLAGLWAGFVEETFHVLDARLCQANCPRAKGDRGQFATNTLIRGKLIRPTCK